MQAYLQYYISVLKTAVLLSWGFANVQGLVVTAIITALSDLIAVRGRGDMKNLRKVLFSTTLKSIGAIALVAFAVNLLRSPVIISRADQQASDKAQCQQDTKDMSSHIAKLQNELLAAQQGKPGQGSA